MKRWFTENRMSHDLDFLETIVVSLFLNRYILSRVGVPAVSADIAVWTGCLGLTLNWGEKLCQHFRQSYTECVATHI